MLNVLVSYAFISENIINLIKSTQGHVRWTLDSGAFTAFHRGSPINIDEYIEFCVEHGHLFDHYIALDVIENAKASKKNLEKMVKAGLKPMAVLTGSDDVNESVELSAVSKSICLGGGTNLPMEVYSTRISKVRELVGKEVWIHGLGFARGLKVASTHVDSVDASSWEEGLRWGSFAYFEPAIGVKSKGWNDIVKTPWKELTPGIRSALVSLGLKKAHLKNKDSINRGSVSLIGIHGAYSWLKFASALQQRGVRFYFAVPGFNVVLMNLIIAAKHSTISGIRWDDCLPDQKVAKETFRNPPKLVLDMIEASKNAERVFNIK